MGLESSSFWLISMQPNILGSFKKYALAIPVGNPPLTIDSTTVKISYHIIYLYYIVLSKLRGLVSSEFDYLKFRILGIKSKWFACGKPASL